MRLPWQKKTAAKADTQQYAPPEPEKQVRVAPQPSIAAELAEQRILNDDTVRAVYTVFKHTVLGSGWKFVGDDAEAAVPVTDAITGARNWPQLLDELAAAPFQRFACVEIIWDGQAWVPMRYRAMPLSATTLATDENGEVEKVTITTTAGQMELPLTNCVVHRYRPTFDQPLGQSFYDWAKEAVQYKRKTDASVMRYIERFAGPSVFGWYPPGTTVEQQNALLAALKKIVGASYGVLPGPRGDNGTQLDLVEPKGEGGGIGVALQFQSIMEMRIARAVLGSVLAMFNAQYGSRAQADTHLEVLRNVIESYQADIELPVNEQLVAPTIAYTMGYGRDVRFQLNRPNFSDLQQMGQWVADLATAGFLDPEADAAEVRQMFGLSERTPEQIAEIAARKEAEPTPPAPPDDPTQPTKEV